MVSILGVCFGVASFLVVLTVLHSVENQLVSAVSRANPDVSVFAENGLAHPSKLSGELKALFPGQIKTTTPFIYQESLLKSQGQSAIVYLKSFPINSDVQFSQLKKVVSPQNALKDFRTPGLQLNGRQLHGKARLLLGSQLAAQLDLRVGDSVNLVYFRPSKGTDGAVRVQSSLLQQAATVVGLMHFGMVEYDSKLGFLNFEDGKKLFGKGTWVSGLDLQLNHRSNAIQIAKKLNENYPFSARSWKEMSAGVLEHIQRDGASIQWIVLVISIVASFNVIVTLTLTVIDKTKQIAILRSLGARRRHIMSLFIFCSLFLGLTGSILGIMVAGGILKFFQGMSLGHFKELYFFESIPVQFHFSFVAVCFVAANVLCLISALYPAWRASRIPPIVGLKQG